MKKAAWAGAGVVAAGAVCAAGYYAIAYPESQVFGRTLVAPPEPGQVALTFDDGPNPAATPRLLDVLANAGVRATFFLIGKYVRTEPGLARRIAAEGHVVGNHTMGHPWLPRLSEAEIRREIVDCHHALQDVLGAPVELFRPPYGARRPAVVRVARELGMRTVMWNLIVGDWNPLPAKELLRRLSDGIGRNREGGRGTCAVLHDGGLAGLGEPRLPTVAAVEELLKTEGARTRFVTPPER